MCCWSEHPCYIFSFCSYYSPQGPLPVSGKMPSPGPLSSRSLCTRGSVPRCLHGRVFLYCWGLSSTSVSSWWGHPRSFRCDTAPQSLSLTSPVTSPCGKLLCFVLCLHVCYVFSLLGEDLCERRVFTLTDTALSHGCEQCLAIQTNVKHLSKEWIRFSVRWAHTVQGSWKHPS